MGIKNLLAILKTWLTDHDARDVVAGVWKGPNGLGEFQNVVGRISFTLFRLRFKLKATYTAVDGGVATAHQIVVKRKIRGEKNSVKIDGVTVPGCDIDVGIWGAVEEGAGFEYRVEMPNDMTYTFRTKAVGSLNDLLFDF